MISRVGMAGLALLVAAPAFRYERPVQLAPDKDAETCVVLPVDLLTHAAPQLQDLRLLAGEREVAYRVRTSSDAAAEQARAEQILNLGRRNGAISFDVQMTEPRYSRVVLKMARSHFSVLVHVTGIDHPGEAGVAFPEIAYSSDTPEEEPQAKLIRLPVSSFPYLHFEVQTLALEPLTPQDIAGVDVLVESSVPPRYTQVAQAGAPQQKEHASVYEFAVPVNVPAERLSFASDDPNAVFSRSAYLERYSNKSNPEADKNAARTSAEMPVQNEAVLVTHSPADRDRSMLNGTSTIDLAAMGDVPYPSTVRLTINNGDDAPLALHNVVLQMRERQLCFLRKPDTAYTLRYGDRSLGPPQYDLSPIEAAAASVSASTLGAERALSPQVAEKLRPFTERHPVLLWIALILVVGTLGAVALRSARS